MPYTHGHAVVNVWILGQWCLPQKDHRLWASIVLGGMMPDFPLLIFMILEIPKHGPSVAFDEIYFEQAWQDIFGYFHSLPLTFLASLGLVCISIPVYARATMQSTWELVSKSWRKMTRDGDRSSVVDSRGAREELENDIEAPPSQDNSGSDSLRAVVLWTQSAWLFAASMFLHALADLGLHTNDAHSQFLPFSRYKLRSKISYYEVTEYSWIWMPIETTLVFFACRYMWRNLSKRYLRFLVYFVLVSYCFLLAVTMVTAIMLVV